MKEGVGCFLNIVVYFLILYNGLVSFDCSLVSILLVVSWTSFEIPRHRVYYIYVLDEAESINTS